MTSAVLSELHRRVTNAIVRAQMLEVMTPAHAEAWREVSVIEESIARLTLPSETEGKIARRGAVSAALWAGDRDRASRLAWKYLGEQLAPELADQIRELMEEKPT